MFEYSFYNDVCFHWGKLDKIILVEKYENDHTWDNCLLLSTVEAGKPLLESVQHYYIILWFCLFVFCLRNWYRMQKMRVPRRLGFYMMKLSMEQKLYGQRTWHNIRVNIIFINFGHYSSIRMWFCVFHLALWRWPCRYDSIATSTLLGAYFVYVLTLIILFQSQCLVLKALNCLLAGCQ